MDGECGARTDERVVGRTGRGVFLIVQKESVRLMAIRAWFGSTISPPFLER